MEHLLIISLFIALFLVFRRKPEVNKYNVTCIDQYFVLLKRIRQISSDDEILTVEDYLHEYYREFICRADNSLVRRLCGELHAALQNKYKTLHEYQPSLS